MQQQQIETDDVKDKFYEDVYSIDSYIKSYIKFQLGDFNAKLGTETKFIPTIRNKVLHEISKDNAVGKVNFGTL
jgi:hypothetical protein